jgi:Sulfotransferase family
VHELGLRLWSGRARRTLRVIGDKRAGVFVRALADHPDLLEWTRTVVGVPLRLVHVVRNPWDNIAAMSQWHALSIDESIGYYFAHCQVTGRLHRFVSPREMITVHHEHLVENPAAGLAGLCEFLGLDHDAAYLSACRSTEGPVAAGHEWMRRDLPPSSHRFVPADHSSWIWTSRWIALGGPNPGGDDRQS